MQIAGRTIGAASPEGWARPFLIAGPCVIESEALCLTIADHLARLARRLNIMVIFKASFDKANRTAHTSFRGIGIDEGLTVLTRVRDRTGLPVLTDVHNVDQVAATAQAVDMLQTPAFLARQTDLIAAAASSGCPVNIKKAQFMAPCDMTQVVAKARAAARHAGLSEDRFLVCERGTAFGYHNLVVDMRALVEMRETACPVVFDATHSVQLPGAQGASSGGQPEHIAPLSRAAVAVGINALFMETHPDPAQALSDGPNAIPLDHLDRLVAHLLRVAEVAHG
jgi:2-dehydro-3-deoxyphosphooctonate aldolase (KDO 8-P synthase)